MNTATSAHAAPLRAKVDLLMLGFGIVAGPAVWALRLWINFAFASHLCSTSAAASHNAPASIGAFLVISDLTAMAIAAYAGVISYRHWQATRHQKAGNAGHLIEAGEGRTRFLAICGVVTSGLFVVAIAFDVVGILVNVPCR